MSEAVSKLSGRHEAAGPLREVNTTSSRGAGSCHLRVALLTNIIPPFRKPLFQELSRRCKQFRVFISTPMESNRQWQVNWEGLDVIVQRTVTLIRRIGHNSSSDERQFVHFPVDTVPALMRFGADAVISSELGFRTSGALIYRLMNRKTRLLTWVCVSESTEAQRGMIRHKFRKFLLAGIDGFLVNGESGARYLRKMGVSGSKIFLAPYPTDVNRFANSEVTRDPASMYRMLYVGQFVERKGLLPFCRVLARWATANPSSRIELVLVGSGPLEAAILSAPLPANVSMSIRAFVPYDEIGAVYRNAGIFVFPSLADEWGTVVSEAMACGLPVLGSVASQAVEELVEEGANGWLFDPAEEDQVLEAIDRCVHTSAADLNKMRSAAKESALRLSPEAVADQVMDALEVCCK